MNHLDFYRNHKNNITNGASLITNHLTHLIDKVHDIGSTINKIDSNREQNSKSVSPNGSNKSNSTISYTMSAGDEGVRKLNPIKKSSSNGKLYKF